MLTIWTNKESQVLSGNQIKDIPQAWSHLYVRKTAFDKTVKALESLDQPLCERIIDPCGFKPEDLTKEQLVALVRTLSDENEVSLNVVRSTLESIKEGKT